MSLIQAVRSGCGRVVASPWLIAGLWLVNLVVALPAAVVMTSAIHESVGASLVSAPLTEGFDLGWYGEFEHEAKGLERTFTPTVAGAGAFYDNLEAWFEGSLFTAFTGLVGLGVAYALLWALLLGGILERYALDGGERGLAALLGAGGRWFFRFARLAVASGVLYLGVYRLARWVFGWIGDATRDVTAETQVLYRVLPAALGVALLLVVVHVAFDYAKIAMVVEQRRSALLAALRGLVFVVRHPVRTLGLYVALAAAGLLLLGVYALVAPEAGPSTWAGVAAAFLLGQALLAARLSLRLTTWAGEAALYRALSAPPAAESPEPPEREEESLAEAPLDGEPGEGS